MALPNRTLISYARVSVPNLPHQQARKIKGIIKLPDRCCLVTASAQWLDRSHDKDNQGGSVPEVDHRETVVRVTKE